MAEMSNRVYGQGPAVNDDDAALVAACRKGDVNAFEGLVERHQKRMFNIAFRVTGDYEEACDVVQESFLSAYRAIGSFRGEAKFSTWLYGITVNHARNRIKQIRGRSRHEAPVDDPAGMDCLAADVSMQAEKTAVEQLEQREIQLHVQRCIETLEEEQRVVVVLRDIQGFSYEEIRDMLKVPEGTVKSRLFRARDGLKECLKKVLRDL